jgi:cohesin complex subunit SCC1
MRYMEISADPISHFFPTKITDDGSFYCLAPPGIAPEIADLFLFPIAQGAGQKRKGQLQNERANKRQRLGSEPVDDIEFPLARHGSAAPSLRHDSQFGAFEGFGDDSGFLPNDESMPIEDFQFQLDDSVHLDQQASSRHVTPGADLLDDNVRGYGAEDSLVSMFESQLQTQDNTQPTTSPSKTAGEKEDVANKDGYSRNTVKAIGLLRQELEEMRSSREKALSFKTLTDKVILAIIPDLSWLIVFQGSRRAASSFFFELLVLGTRDCLQLSQAKAFDDIKIQGKPRLWEGQIQDDKLV